MNDVVKNFKKGHKIHIKESLKGTFTKWCGGNVTDECILRGKNSSNPKIRKKATFAANARKWKHKEGGIIKALFGESLDVDRRRDITGDYITSQLPRWGAVDQSNTAGLWDVLNYNITNNPYIITGEPIILPGRFGGFRSGKLVNKKWLENSNPITSEGSALAAKDWLTEIGYKYNPKGKAIKIESTAMEQVAKKRGRPVGSKNKPAPVKEEKPVQILKTDYTQSGTATERYIEGKRYGISRKGRVSSNDKNARALEGEDARIKNAGYTNVKKGLILQVEKNLDKYPKFEIENHNKLLLRLYRKNRSEAEINKVKREFYKYLAKKYGYFKIGGIIKAADGTKTNFFLKAGNWINNNKDLVSSFANAGLGIVSNIKLNKAIDTQIEANEKLMEVNKQQAFMDNYTKALGMLSDRSDIVNRNKAWLIANSLNYSNDELENENFLLQQSKVGMLDYLGGLSTDILNNLSNKKSSSNNPPSDSYFGNYVKTLFKNPGTFNSDGSFNTSLGAYKFENGKYLKVNTNPLSNLKFNI